MTCMRHHLLILTSWNYTPPVVEYNPFYSVRFSQVHIPPDWWTIIARVRMSTTVIIRTIVTDSIHSQM